MGFRFYITDLFEGAIEGTNNEQKAVELSACEEYFVVDTKTGEWITSGGDRREIKERE